MSEGNAPAAGAAGQDSAWQQMNNDYLTAALYWLNLRLRRLAEQQVQGGEPVRARVGEPARTGIPGPRARRWPFGGEETASTPQPAALPPPANAVSEAEVAQAAAALDAYEKNEPPPRLVQLARIFGLNDFERQVLFLCAATEFDPRVAPLCARIHNDPGQATPTFALALALFPDPDWGALAPDHPLRHWRLLEINQPGAQPLTASALRADERITNYLKGLDYLDDRLAPLVAPLVDGGWDGDLAASQQAAVERIFSILEESAPPRDLPVIQLLGNDAPSKRLVAGRAARELGLAAFRLPAEEIPSHPGELETLARLWQREMALLPVVLYLDAFEVERSEGRAETSGELSGRVVRLLERSRGLFFLDTREHWPGLRAPHYSVEVTRPTAREQEVAWSEALGDKAGKAPAVLAGQFDLDLGSIGRVAERALAEFRTTGGEQPPEAEPFSREAVPPGEPDPQAPCYTRLGERPAPGSLAHRLWQSCLSLTRPRLDTLAQRLDAKARWEDLILPPAEQNLLCEITAQVRQRSQVYDDWGFRERMNRGLGISVLFAGESGVGKTMAAEVIANELELNLYRIDLSAVVSKYIGETEKNLRRLFDAAENGGALLFFDEADALFGKRSEVKDSHDRYANIEINYLLQRMEAFQGLAILATNMKSALDTAFLRRLRFIVNFPVPDQALRGRIWERVFPAGTPLAQDAGRRPDWDRLARFKITGGSIHNIALNAAFLAARQDPPEVTMALLLDATRTELRKQGLPVNEADFSLGPAKAAPGNAAPPNAAPQKAEPGKALP